GDGAFGPNRGIKPADFLDGFSNTLAAEDVKAYNPMMRNGGNHNLPNAPMPSTPGELIALGGTFRADACRTTWVDGKVHETGFTTLFAPNTRVPYVDNGTEYDVDFTSSVEGNTARNMVYAAVTARSYHS